MKYKFFIIFIFTVIINLQAKEQREDIWVSLSAETAMYTIKGMATGGSFSVGYGIGSCIGFKGVWLFSSDVIDTLELNFFFRVYFGGKSSYSGSFLQLAGGPAFFNKKDEFSFPSSFGMFSIGISYGWRFLFFDRWFVEPSVRAGYPYIVGACVSTGVRF